MRRFLYSLAGICLMHGAGARGADGYEPSVVTPTQLNANPDAYDHHYVRVRGYVVVDFEKRFLVEDQESYESWPNKNICITLVSYANPLQVPGLENMKLQIVTGVFIKDIYKGRVLRSGACNKTAIDLDLRPR